MSQMTAVRRTSVRRAGCALIPQALFMEPAARGGINFQGTSVLRPGLGIMADDLLLKTGDVEISSNVARFGATTYQIANIESLTVERRRRMNSVALFLFFFSLGFLVSGFVVGGYLSGVTWEKIRTGPGMYLFGAGVVLWIVGMLIQLVRPRISSALILKTASGDIDALVSDDGEHVVTVQRALEVAFGRRG
jgi:hypothetical protein